MTNKTRGGLHKTTLAHLNRARKVFTILIGQMSVSDHYSDSPVARIWINSLCESDSRMRKRKYDIQIGLHENCVKPE